MHHRLWWSPHVWVRSMTRSSSRVEIWRNVDSLPIICLHGSPIRIGMHVRWVGLIGLISCYR
uniref:Uncharacterized protein n=1 Tax=Medicago truncatula TaxID=3880 RepID=I3SAI7_MEDTR|nr:unknown [Medicago truncatula]